MIKTVYIVMKGSDIDCYSNLSKLTRDYINVGYYQAYYKLQQNNSVEIAGYTIVKAIVK